MIEKNIDHLNLDLDKDGELERYNLVDKRVEENLINYSLDETGTGMDIGGGFSGSSPAIFPKLFNTIEFVPNYVSSFDIKTEGACNLTMGDGVINMTWTGGSNIAIIARYIKEVDLTDLDKIILTANVTAHYSANFYLSIAVSETIYQNWLPQSQILQLPYAVHSNALGDIILELDVSQLTGNYYFYLFTPSTRGVISNIEFIKN